MPHKVDLRDLGDYLQRETNSSIASLAVYDQDDGKFVLTVDLVHRLFRLNHGRRSERPSGYSGAYYSSAYLLEKAVRAYFNKSQIVGQYDKDSSVMLLQEEVSKPHRHVLVYVFFKEPKKEVCPSSKS